MVATGALGSQEPVGKNPAAKVLFELFNHKIWKWIAQVMLHLLLERGPVGLDQFVECSFFGFVALVVIGLGIKNRHRQMRYLQLSWPFRIALLTSAVELWSEIAIRLRDRVRSGQVGEPFGRRSNPYSEKLFVSGRLLPFIHSLADQKIDR